MSAGSTVSLATEPELDDELELDELLDELLLEALELLDDELELLEVLDELEEELELVLGGTSLPMQAESMSAKPVSASEFLIGRFAETPEITSNMFQP